YFAAAHDLGSAAATPSQVGTLPDPARVTADAELVDIYHLAPAPAQLPSDHCLAVARPPFSGNGSAPPAPAVPVPAGGLEVPATNGDAPMGIRRFADQFEPLGVIASGSRVAVRVPPDHSPQPWQMSIEPQGHATVCTAGA